MRQYASARREPLAKTEAGTLQVSKEMILMNYNPLNKNS